MWVGQEVSTDWKAPRHGLSAFRVAGPHMMPQLQVAGWVFPAMMLSDCNRLIRAIPRGKWRHSCACPLLSASCDRREGSSKDIRSGTALNGSWEESHPCSGTPIRALKLKLKYCCVILLSCHMRWLYWNGWRHLRQHK